MSVANIMKAVEGKKTYVVAFSAFLSVLVGWSTGKVSHEDFIKDTFGLVLSVTMRHGISTSSKPKDDPVEPSPAPPAPPDPVVPVPVVPTPPTPTTPTKEEHPNICSDNHTINIIVEEPTDKIHHHGKTRKKQKKK